MAFPGNCSGRVIAVDASTGCTLTRASIRGMTPQDFEDQGLKEVGMDKIITRAQQARVAGVQENALEDLIYSRMAPIKTSVQQSKIGASESIILPFIYRRQKRNINSNYWLIDTTGTNQATPGAGSGGVHPGSWDITVKKSASPWATTLTSVERYFVPGKYVIVEWYNATSKVAYSSQFKITAAANASTNTATITLEPSKSSVAWAGFSAAQKLPFQPTYGMVYILANSISDYESWCSNEVAENPNSLLTYWLQTTRETHEYNDEYLRALNAALLSGYFKDFRALPLAEQKRIQHQKFVRSWLNSVFFGQEINEYQSVETYQSLPQVRDPLAPDCTLEYKANALGFATMLDGAHCARTVDHQGNVLNLNLLFENLYAQKRAREADGGSVEVMDVMTDRWTADAFLVKMIDFYKTKYQVNYERFYQPGEALRFDNNIVLNYNRFQLPPALGGYTIAMFWHPFFDDRLTAFTASASGLAPTGDLANVGRALWAIDWSDVLIGIAGSTSVQRQTNVADDLYNCIIKPNIRHYMLNSQQWTSILEDPSRHMIVKNFSEGEMTLS